MSRYAMFYLKYTVTQISQDLDTDEDQANTQQENENTSSMCDVADSKNNEELIQITTKTISKRMAITWDIDERSLLMARAQRKHRDSSVILATIKRDGMEFKLELCTLGWKSSQPGYCAWYLTIPNATDSNGNDLVARYNISVELSFVFISVYCFFIFTINFLSILFVQSTTPSGIKFMLHEIFLRFFISFDFIFVLCAIVHVFNYNFLILYLDTRTMGTRVAPVQQKV